MFQERRRYERMSFAAGVTLIDLAKGIRCEGCCVDLSRGGVGFFCRRFLPTGTRVRLVFHLAVNGQESAPVVDAVVRWARVENDGAVMGAEFDVPLRPDLQPVLCECLVSA